MLLNSKEKTRYFGQSALFMRHGCSPPRALLYRIDNRFSMFLIFAPGNRCCAGDSTDALLRGLDFFNRASSRLTEISSMPASGNTIAIQKSLQYL